MEYPTAWQTDVLEHDTPFRSSLPVGRLCGVQVLPPLIVASTNPVPDELSPTTMQSDVLAHERPFTRKAEGRYF
jgi:hypothetical protein